MKKALFLLGMTIAFSTAGADEVNALAWSEFLIRMYIAVICIAGAAIAPQRKGNH